MPAEGCAQTPVVPAAVTRDGAPGTRQDPLVEEACAGGAKGGDAAEEVGAKPPHVVVKVGHLGGVNNGEGGFLTHTWWFGRFGPEVAKQNGRLYIQFNVGLITERKTQALITG